MKRCLIVGAGSVYDADLPLHPKKGDLVIAADGGLQHLQQWGQTPNLLIGDFDSMKNPELPIETLVLPIQKDDTDMVYAVKEGFRRGYTHFVLYGGLGGTRLSHTLANLQLLAYIKQQGGQGELVGGNTRVVLLQNESQTFAAPLGTHCSVLAYSPKAVVSLQGLYYPLEKGEITNRFPVGVSNHSVLSEFTVTAHQGDVLVVLEQ